MSDLFQLSKAYQATYGWTRRDSWLQAANVVGVSASVGGLVAGVNHWLGLAALTAFVATPAVTAARVAMRRTALRVDEHGVTLGAPVPLPARFHEFVPWSDLIAIYTWRRGIGVWTTWCVGLQLRQDAPVRRSWLRDLRSVSVPDGVPRSVSYHTRRDIGWRLDRDRLAEAVALFAPHVSLVEVSRA